VRVGFVHEAVHVLQIEGDPPHVLRQQDDIMTYGVRQPQFVEDIRILTR
jgi:hypothetical protein